jgi:hypothetical protein
MKTKILFRLFPILLILPVQFQAFATNPVSQEKTEILITRNTTQQELEQMIKELEDKGIDLKVAEVKYTRKGRVQSISGEVHFNDGHSGSFEAQRFKSILIVRDYNPEAKKAFDIVILR